MNVATSAVITLATCLKDIIKLAQELKRTIDKIPQNRRNARKLSDELLTGLLDIEKFYENRSAMLEGNPELADALAKLLTQTTAVQVKCAQLFAPSDKRGWRKIGSAMKAWRDCDRVEQEIGELKDLVHECYRKFTMMAIARLEQPVNQIKITPIEGMMVNLDKNQSLMLENMEGFLTTLQGSGPTDPIFIQPSKDVVNTLYLHNQVETISTSLADLSVSRTFANEEPNEQYLLPFKTVIGRSDFGVDPDDSHREVVAKTLEIIKLLKGGDSAELSIQDGAWEMVNLAIRLHGLEMYSDAESMGRWTATMFRALVAKNPAVYEPYLALSLRNLSRYKARIHDDEGSSSAISECLEIQRRLVQESPTLEARSQLANTLNEYWSVVTKKGNAEKGLEIAKESVAITDAIRAEIATWDTWLQHAPPSPPPPYIKEPAYVEVEDVKPPIERPPTPEPPLAPALDEDETMWLEFNTARALCCLSFSLEDNQRIEEAYETELRSLSAYQALSERHGETFDENLAGSYAHLASAILREGRPSEQSMIYAERALDIYRKGIKTQPLKFTPWLLETLWDYASLLNGAGRIEDVTRISEEALGLVRKSNENRKLLADALQASSGKLRGLKLNDTAVVLRTEAVGIYRSLPISDSSSTPSASIEVVDSTVVPESLKELAAEFLFAKKMDEAVVACKEAVDIYRANLKESPSTDTSLALARSLSYLSYCMIMAKDYDSALVVSTEATTMFREQFHELGSEFKAAESYVFALRRTTIAAFYVDSVEAITANATVVEDLRMLAVDHKETVGNTLLHALHDRDFILGKHRRLREAIKVNEEMFKLLPPLPITDVTVASDYIAAATTYGGNIYEIGRAEDAILTLQKAVDLGSSFSDDVVTADAKFAGSLAGARATLAGCLHNLGRYVEAEAVMKLSVEASRVHLKPAEDTLLACRYRTYAGILRCLPGRLDEALKLGEDAVALCRASTTKALFTEARLPYNLESYAVSVADSGDTQRALVLVQESVKLYRELKAQVKNPLLPWVYAASIYASALMFLACCLMETDDCAGAYELLKEAETIYQDMLTHTPSQFSEYVQCLDLLSLNRRAMGFHSEGKTIADDLCDRERAMEVFNPQLAAVARASLAELRGGPFQTRLRQYSLRNTHIEY